MSLALVVTWTDISSDKKFEQSLQHKMVLKFVYQRSNYLESQTSSED